MKLGLEAHLVLEKDNNLEKLSYNELLQVLNYYRQRAIELEFISVENEVRSRTLNGQMHDLNSEFQKMVDYYQNKEQSEQIEKPTIKDKTKEPKSD